LRLWHPSKIGRHLIEAKDRVGHGHYLAWIERDFHWSERSAQHYAAIAEQFQDRPSLADLSVWALELLAGDSTPPEVRDEVLPAGRPRAGA
jgi:hypothetical protein